MITNYILVGGIAMFIGIIAGIILGRAKNSCDGIFKVDTTDPNKDVFTVELHCPIGEIPKRKHLFFLVENVSSQEKPFA